MTLLTDRLRRDAECFQTKLSKIDGFGDLGELLLELVDRKTIEAGEAEKPSSPQPDKPTSH